MMRRLLPWMLCLGLVVTQPACSGPPSHYSAEAIEARVIDAESKKPLEGVIVTANWQLLGGMEGSLPLGQMMVMESVTNRDGAFRFPSWGPLKRPQGYLREGDPQLLLFKSGYEYQRLSNPVSSKINHDSIRRSQWNGKTIALKPFKGTGEEYADHIYRLRNDIVLMLDFSSGSPDCNWKRTPRMLVALYQLGLRLEQEGGKRTGWRAGEEISRILEDIPSSPQCGTAEEFLKDYLP